MVGIERHFLVERMSLTKPPTFLREKYPYQNDYMEMYIKSIHYQLWTIITKGNINIKVLEEDWTR